MRERKMLFLVSLKIGGGGEGDLGGKHSEPEFPDWDFCNFFKVLKITQKGPTSNKFSASEKYGVCRWIGI